MAPEHAKMDVSAEPQPDVAPSDQVDCFSQMVKLGQEEELPEMDTINERLATVEQRMGKSVREHLGFGLVSASAIKVVDGDIGEFNEDNKLHGRGMNNYYNGIIGIGYYKDGECATGNYLEIWSDGNFEVGECYLKDGKLCYRGTQYKTDGTTEEFDVWVILFIKLNNINRVVQVELLAAPI